MVAAQTPNDVDISLTDECIAAIDLQKEIDLVGISTITTTAHRAYEIADAFRTKGVKVVLGGVHPSILPEEASQHADAVVIGEAEGIWPKVIDDFKAGGLKSFYSQERRPSLAGLPLPRRDLFANSGYFIKNVMSTSRGCPFSCSFCSVGFLFGHSYRFRPIDDIRRELDSFKSGKILFFNDDNIVGNFNFAKDLFRVLIPYKKKWYAQASVNVAKDDELLALARDSGCFYLFIGFESISPAVLSAVGKKVNVVEEYEEAVQNIHSHGIAVHGMFVFGFDEDDKGVFERTVHFCRKLKLDTASFAILAPYPGTAIYESLDKAGRILTKDWSRYDDVVFEPKQMSVETLRKGTDWAWREFYKLPSIYDRLGIRTHTLSGLGLWAMNIYLRSRYIPERARRMQTIGS